MSFRRPTLPCLVGFALALALPLGACGGDEVAPSVCGDGAVTGAEACDDGNAETEFCIYGEQSCTVCTAACEEGPGHTAFCGDEEVTGIEQCDDGNAIAEVCDYGVDSCTICDGGCQLVPGLTRTCGDGDIQAPEECDDNNQVTEVCPYGFASCSVCDQTCNEVPGATALCGDDLLNGDEECDLGPDNTVDCPYGQPSCEVCSIDCQWIPGATHLCGDGLLHGEEGEECDGSDAIDCHSLGYDPGVASCELDCSLDTTTCTVDGVPRVLSFPAVGAGFTLPPSPTLGINDQDLAAMTYLHASAGSTEIRVSREVSKGDWQTATVAWDEDAGRGPALATGPGGLLGVTWPGEPEAGLGDRALWLARTPDGFAWTATQIAGGDPLDPVLALDATGLATIAHYAYEGSPSAHVLVKREQADGTWTTHALTEKGASGDGMAITLDEAGLPVVAFLHGGDHGDLQVARMTGDGDWETTLVAASDAPRAWPALTTRPIDTDGEVPEEVLVACGGEGGLLLASDGGAGAWDVEGLVLLGINGPSQVGVAMGPAGNVNVSWVEVLDDGVEVLGLARIEPSGYYEKKALFQWPDWSTQAADLQWASLVVRGNGESLVASTVILNDQVVVVTEPPWQEPP